MGIFGTSKNEEDALRNASTSEKEKDLASRRISESGLSLYMTADEESRESVAHETPKPSISLTNDAASDVASTTSTIKAQPTTIGGAQTPAETIASSYENSESHDDLAIEHYEPQIRDSVLPEADEGSEADLEDEDEDQLNRRFTLERQSTHRTIDDVADTEIRRSTTRASANAQGIDINDLDWDDINDKGDPKNWPSWKKWYITFSVAGICLCVSLGSSLYVSGVPEIEKRFGCSQELAISGLTFYLLGLAFGPVFAAPLSEMFGRRWIYVFSLPISMLFTMGIGLSQNIYSILIQRFFCGLFASPALAVAGGSISDIWAPEHIGFAMALFCLAPFLGPVLGPVVGNFAAEHKGWRFTMWVSLMFSGAVLIPVVFLPETYKRKILYDRAKKRGIQVNIPNLDFKQVVVTCVKKPMAMLFTDAIVFFFSFYIAFVFAVLFGFFEAFPIIFLSVYKMKQGPSGLPFIGVGVGLMLGVGFFIVLDKFVFFKKNPDGTRGKRDENGNMIWDPPETKLVVGQVGCVFLPISLFWLGWTSRELIHWISPTLSGVAFGFGLILVFFMCILYFSMAFPPANVASALAANNFIRYILAGVFPLFTVQMYKRLGIDWASSLFAFIALAMVPVPFIFAKYGAQFRAKSKYGYAAFFKAMAAKKAAAAAAAQHAPKKESTVEPESKEAKTFEDSSEPEDVSLRV